MATVTSSDKKDTPKRLRRKRTRPENTAWLLERRKKKDENRKLAEADRILKGTLPKAEAATDNLAATAHRPQQVDPAQTEERKRMRCAELYDKYRSLCQIVGRLSREQYSRRVLSETERLELDLLLAVRDPEDLLGWINRVEYFKNRMTTS